MALAIAGPGPHKTRRAIVKLLKTEGPMDAAQLAKRLALTAMAVRQHLYELQREKLAAAEERPAG
ncbi:MAG: helix-turn-helix domain-containing protein, partial [bacterium]